MKKTVYLTSKQDGLKLHVLLMEPEQSPKGIVQICHGMAEHKERYEPLMQMLCNNYRWCCIYHCISCITVCMASCIYSIDHSWSVYCQDGSCWSWYLCILKPSVDPNRITSCIEQCILV